MDNLKAFLLRHAMYPEMVAPALADLEPFVQAGKSQRYSLASIVRVPGVFAPHVEEEYAAKQRTLEGRITGALTSVLQREVTRVEFISVHRPYNKLDALATKVSGRMQRDYGEEYYDHGSHDVDAALRLTALQLNWKKEGYTVVKRGLPRNMCTDLSRVLAADVVDALRSLPHECDSRALVSYMSAAAQATMFYYLGYLILGDRERVARIRPLLQLLPEAVPFAELCPHPAGEWLVAVQ